MNQLLGQNVIIRTVTFHYTGRLIASADGFLALADAAWIADSGRWAKALQTGELSEVEPYPGTAYIAFSAVVDISHWPHDLPRTTK